MTDRCGENGFLGHEIVFVILPQLQKYSFCYSSFVNIFKRFKTNSKKLVRCINQNKTYRRRLLNQATILYKIKVM